MARTNLSRDLFIPKGAVAVPDPASDAVLYVAKTEKGLPHAAMFYGTQSRPVWKYVFKSQMALENEVKRSLEARRRTVAYKAEQAAARKAEGNPWKVGDIAYTSWGYDQTNVSAYQCVEVRGMVAIFRRVVVQSTRGNCGMSDYVHPVRDCFVDGEHIRVMAKGGGKIEGQYLKAWDGKQELYRSWYA
jgi:hypothetical protein